MAGPPIPVLRLLVLAWVLVPVPVATQTLPRADEGVSGYVLGPDGTPVSGGTVAIESPGWRATAAIGANGHFRIEARIAGLHEIRVSVAGLSPYRVQVTVPPSRTLELPVIRLSPGTYFRARFVSSTGEPITSGRIVRSSRDRRGMPIPDSAGAHEQFDADGTATIGPLPRGITALAIDAPPLARTRLPDVEVAGDTALVDGGTVVIDPGAVLNVDVVTDTGAPVHLSDVSLTDAAPFSPLSFSPQPTNKSGRATFDRLAAGRYRIVTGVFGHCNDRPLSIDRTIAVPGTGNLRTRLVVSGSAVFRLTSAGAPMRGVTIAAAPDLTEPQQWTRPAEFLRVYAAGFGYRPTRSWDRCSGTTDGDGRVTLTTFPPGPARVEIRLLESTLVRRVNVPPGSRELVLEVPNGFLPVRAIDAVTGARVAGAEVSWTAGGARVQARTSASGDALLGGVSASAGLLGVREPRFQPLEIKLPEPPNVLHEVALVPLPARAVHGVLGLRVVAAAGEPVANAVVTLAPEDPLEPWHVAATDAKGAVALPVASAGALHVAAAADGYVTAGLRIPPDPDGDVVLTLSRGYRVLANVEPSIGAGRYAIGVVDAAGTSTDHLLDAASDRAVEAAGRVSLGPLPPGAYVVQLRSARGEWRERVQIVDRDAQVTFR